MWFVFDFDDVHISHVSVYVLSLFVIYHECEVAGKTT